MPDRLDRAADALGSLVDPVRREMYRFVRTGGRPVSRDEVAQATGTSRKLAAFHLDKLVERGLLRATFGRSEHRTGGRPPKLYELSGVEVELSLPGRRYDLLGEILVAAVEVGGPEVIEATLSVARERGRQLGAEIKARTRLRPPGPERALAIARAALGEQGFEPVACRPGEVALANCPFRAVADTAPQVVCRLNQGFIEGLFQGLEARKVNVELDPGAGGCCVVLRAHSSSPGKR